MTSFLWLLKGCFFHGTEVTWWGVHIYIWKQLMLPRHVTEEKWSKIRRMYVRMWGEQTKGDAAEQCGAPQPHGWEGEREDLHVSQGRKQGSTDTLVVVGGLSKRRVGCVCACPSRAAGIISSCQWCHSWFVCLRGLEQIHHGEQKAKCH